MALIKSKIHSLGTHCPLCKRHVSKLYYLEGLAPTERCATCFANFIEGEHVIIGEN